MARGNKRKKKGKKGPSGAAAPKKGKMKYGQRTKSKSKRKVTRKKKEAAKKKTAKKKSVRKKTAPRGRVRGKGKGKQKDPDGPDENELIWDANFARAVQLYEEDPVLWWRDLREVDESFDRWLRTQRYNRSSGKLRPDREARLKKIAFVWDPVEFNWDYSCNQLHKYIRKGGDGWWKRLEDDEPELGRWAARQRINHSQGKLDPDQVARLDKIGFVWNRLEAQWEASFKQLAEALEDRPSGRLDPADSPDKLRLFAMAQRRAKRNGEISPEHERRLDEIGFAWDATEAYREDVWMQHLEELKILIDLGGDPNPGPDADESTFRWLQLQRRRWDELAEERREMLEELGVSRETPAGQSGRRGLAEPDWDKFFRQCAEFEKKHGHLRISPFDGVANDFPGLANFAGRVRTGTIEPSNEQMDKLDGMGFVWDLQAARSEEYFDTRFAQLVAFKEEHGHTNASQLDQQNLALGQWVQRMRQTREKLSEEQRARLDGIGFVWELKKEWMEGQWEKRFAELVDYRERFGDCLVPQKWEENSTLTRWVARMRQTKAKLNADQVRRLDEIGFVWDARKAEKEAIENERLAEFAAFVKENGHARVTRGNDPTGGVLNRWLVRQRGIFNKGNLPEELRKKLDDLGFLWKTR